MSTATICRGNTANARYRLRMFIRRNLTPRIWKWRIQKWRYQHWHGIKIGFDADGTILPCLGSNKYATVRMRGAYTEIITAKGTIRIIPADYNLGVMVEICTPQGFVLSRQPFGYGRFASLLGEHEERGGPSAPVAERATNPVSN